LLVSCGKQKVYKVDTSTINKMKKTSIKVGEDLALRLNQLKYLWQLKSQDAVIRRLIEICSKIETARSKN